MVTVLNFCPYLPLRSSCAIGPWQFMPASEYTGTWLSPEFEAASRTFLTHFHGVDRQPVESPTLVAHAEMGIDGDPLTGVILDALQGALDFVFLDAGERWDEDASQGSMAALYAMTSDNTELFVWPVDSQEGHFVIDRGLLVRTWSSGHRLDNPEDIIACPVEVHIPSGAATVDEEVAAALYQALLEADPMSGSERTALAGRLTTALRWWARAHRNTRSITWEDRIVMLKTAFEALLDESKAWPGALRLREWFETRVTEQGDLYWSPDDVETLTIKLQGSERSVTPLEHWFIQFCFLRNAIVHEGAHITHATESYSVKGPYKGPFFHRADEVFRQAIKVALVDFGVPNLWHHQFFRRIPRALPDMSRDEDEGTNREPD